MLYSADAYTLATPAAVLDKFGADHTCVDQPLALINRSVKLSQTKRNVSKLSIALCDRGGDQPVFILPSAKLFWFLVKHTS